MLPTPMGNRLILQPNDSNMRGSLFVPDTYKNSTTACKVLAIGKNVSPFIKVNDVVFCEAAFGDRNNNTLDGSRSFWATDLNVYAKKLNNKIQPLGRRVLIRRDIEDEFKNGILIPSNRRYQSLYGTIERLGLTRKPFKINGLTVGSRVRLTQWESHMEQIDLEDGRHGMIVLDTDILFMETNE